MSKPIVRHDTRRGLRYEWPGRGHLVNVFDGDKPLHAFSVGDFSTTHARVEDVRRAIAHRLRVGPEG